MGMCASKKALEQVAQPFEKPRESTYPAPLPESNAPRILQDLRLGFTQGTSLGARIMEVLSGGAGPVPAGTTNAELLFRVIDDNGNGVLERDEVVALVRAFLHAAVNLEPAAKLLHVGEATPDEANEAVGQIADWLMAHAGEAINERGMRVRAVTYDSFRRWLQEFIAAAAGGRGQDEEDVVLDLDGPAVLLSPQPDVVGDEGDLAAAAEAEEEEEEVAESAPAGSGAPSVAAGSAAPSSAAEAEADESPAAAASAAAASAAAASAAAGGDAAAAAADPQPEEAGSAESVAAPAASEAMSSAVVVAEAAEEDAAVAVVAGAAPPAGGGGGEGTAAAAAPVPSGPE